MRVVVDARLFPGTMGGIEQVCIGLALGLSALDSGDEYIFLTRPGASAWLRPFVSGGCVVVESASETERRPLNSLTAIRASTRLRSAVRSTAPYVRRGWMGIGVLQKRRPGLVRKEPRDVTCLRPDVIHVPHQAGYLSSRPVVYQPHDLQHRHLPELFTRIDRINRDITYRSLCQSSEAVVMMSDWGKRDVLRHFGLPESKVHVIHGGSVLHAYPRTASAAERAQIVRKLKLPDRYIVYPAQTWKHKNHLRVLEAFTLLASRGVRPSLICTGRTNEHYALIREDLHRRGLQNQVRFLGVITPAELRFVTEEADALLYPSLFEGWGLPICEAFAVGVPVACSTATSLPDLAGDAAVLFDPLDIEEMAAAIHTLWVDRDRRAELRRRGFQIARDLTWDHAARKFRALYRSLAGRTLTQEDRDLLSAAPLV
jgi:glycosyltransferase involved in cell wall biosynthesis